MVFLNPVLSALLLAFAVAARVPAAVPEPKTFAVADFGAKGDGAADDGPALQRAIDAAISSGPGSTVSLAAGAIYRLAPHTNDVASLRIGNATNLVLEGNGAMLVAHPSNRHLAIYDSSKIAVRHLTLDYHPLPYTQARLTALDLPAGSVRFQVEPGYDDPTEGNETVYPDHKDSDAVFLDGATRQFTHAWARVKSVRALSNHVFEARFHQAGLKTRFALLKVGDFIAVKQVYPDAKSRRDAGGRFLSSTSPNIYITFSRNVRFEGITSYAAPGMTFVASGAEGIVLEGCRVIRKPGTDRLIASQSDGAHLKSLTVMPQIRDCVFEALMDDSINIKISSEVVKEIRGTRLRLVHGDILTDDLVLQPGQEVSFLGGSPLRHLAYGRIAAVERVRYREAWVTVDKPVPGLAVGDLMFLRPVNDAVVTGCEFRTQLKTALLTHLPTVVSNCVFRDVAYGVHSAMTGRIEGPAPYGIRVQDCDFLQPSVAAIALHLPSVDALPPALPSLVAEDCRITLAGGRGVAFGGGNRRNIVLRNLQITAEDGRSRAELVNFRNCVGIREENVVFRLKE